MKSFDEDYKQYLLDYNLEPVTSPKTIVQSHPYLKRKEKPKPFLKVSP